MATKNDTIQAARALKALREAQVDPAAELTARILSWRKDPYLFFREALGVELSNQQREMCRLVADMEQAKINGANGKKLSQKPVKYAFAIGEYSEEDLFKALGISIHSGNGLGKDFFCAGLVLRDLIVFPANETVGLITANSAKQVEDVFSKEVQRHIKRNPVELWRYIIVDRGGVYAANNGKKSETTFYTKRTAVVRGSEDEQGESLKGIHGPYMKLILDEASGLPDGVFRPIEVTLTGKCNFVILIGNPTRSSGYFYRSHYDPLEAGFWVKVRWNAEESDMDTIQPGLKAQIERMRKYGEDSPAYRIGVLGLPPLVDQNALIPMDWILDAIDRDIEPDPDAPLVFGVDVGRGGDKSAICPRKGGKVFPLHENKDADTMLVARFVARNANDLEPMIVSVDLNGLGAGTYDRLREEKYSDEWFSYTDFSLFGVNVGESPSDDTRYRNLRAELYMKLRDMFQRKEISIPNDRELINELSVIRVKDWEPRVLLVSKKEMRAQGLASPNKADALMLTLYRTGQFRDKSKEERRGRYRFNRAPLEPEYGWMTA